MALIDLIGRAIILPLSPVRSVSFWDDCERVNSRRGLNRASGTEIAAFSAK
jgi:hypothetical protein